MLFYVSVLKEFITSSTSVNGRQCCCTQIRRHLGVTLHTDKQLLDLRKPGCDRGKERHITAFTQTVLCGLLDPTLAGTNTQIFSPYDSQFCWLSPQENLCLWGWSFISWWVSRQVRVAISIHRHTQWHIGKQSGRKSPLKSLYLVSLYSGESQTFPGSYAEIQGKSSLGS